MQAKIGIRESCPDDRAAIESLYPQAFPDEDLLPLVRELIDDPAVTVSLVATFETAIAGHAIFTTCSLPADVKVALLGPVAIAPSRQKQGVGSTLVYAGLQQLEQADVVRVCVLGDPAFYGRLGFRPESAIEPPYKLPDEWLGAWQSVGLRETPAPCKGRLLVPPQWRRPALWAP